MVIEDNNVTLGTMGVVVAVVFDDQEGHGLYGVGCIAFASGVTMLCFVDHNVDVLIEEELFFFLIAS